jgi:hypothetical protein
MPRAYWIEDEIDRLEGAFSMLEDELGDGAVEVLDNVVDVKQSINRIKAQPGPVILDLWIATGELISRPDQPKGPDIGLRLIESLQDQANLTSAWPIFIVSGNIGFAIKDQLIEKYRIPVERIFAKPLNQKAFTLVELVSKAAQDMGSSK